MVEWKGEIERENSGEKAALLDELQDLNVPNFFTLTKNDVEALVGDTDRPEEVLNTDFSDEQVEEIKSAYKQIGMSSEVREASGKAKSLVGGQRDTGRVSVRISSEGVGYEYKLNVGVSDIENALREVIASYYEQESDTPAVIVQKMVESGHSGALIPNYLGSYTLVEVVEGLGISLEEGITSPETYLIQNGQVEEKRVPESQIKITRNPMNGQHRRKKLSKDSASLKTPHIEDFCEKVSKNQYGVKFVYKRGAFYVIDAFESQADYNPFSSTETSLKAIRASKGPAEGTIGREITFTDQTEPPENYGKALIASKGGYTSTDAQKAREAGKPAIFNYGSSFDRGQRVEFSESSVSLDENRIGDRRTVDSTENSFGESVEGAAVTATEILPIDGTGRAVHLSPPFGEGYNVGHGDEAVSSENYLTSYQDVFAFEGEKVVVDARKMAGEGLENALEYVDADLKVLLVENPSKELLATAVRNRYDVIASSVNIEALRARVLREEKKFIMDHVSEL